MWEKYNFATLFPYIFPDQVNFWKKEVRDTLQPIYVSEHNKKDRHWLAEEKELAKGTHYH